MLGKLNIWDPVIQLERISCQDWVGLGLNLGFPVSSVGKESSCNVGDLSSIPMLGRSPGEGKGYPLQYSGLENSKDCIVHRVAKSQNRLNNFHIHFQGWIWFLLLPPTLITPLCGWVSRVELTIHVIPVSQVICLLNGKVPCACGLMTYSWEDSYASWSDSWLGLSGSKVCRL